MRSWERIAGVVGAIPLALIVVPGLMLNEPRFHFKGATIASRSSHDRATIGPRSWVDHDLDSQMNAVWWSWHWFRDEGATISAWSHRDRGSVGPRSWISSTSLPSHSMEIVTWWRSDVPESSTPLQWRSSDGDPPPDEAPTVRCRSSPQMCPRVALIEFRDCAKVHD